LYYKYFILCTILIAAQKFETGQNPELPDTITEQMLAMDYKESSGRCSDQRIFEQACKVIHDYVVGNEPLPPPNKAPPSKGTAHF
jgi:hypothetical protein